MLDYQIVIVQQFGEFQCAQGGTVSQAKTVVPSSESFQIVLLMTREAWCGVKTAAVPWVEKMA